MSEIEMIETIKDQKNTLDKMGEMAAQILKLQTDHAAALAEKDADIQKLQELLSMSATNSQNVLTEKDAEIAKWKKISELMIESITCNGCPLTECSNDISCHEQLFSYFLRKAGE